MRHRAAAAAGSVRGFQDLADFRLREECQILTHLAQAARDQRQPAPVFDDRVALCVPRDRRAEVELAGQCLLNLRAAIAKRRKRAGRPTELHHQEPRLELGQPPPVPGQRREPVGRLQTERDRRCLLAVRPSGHDGVLVAIGERDQRVDRLLQPFFDQRRGAPNRQDRRRVDDVLAGGAAMDEPGVVGAHRVAQLANQLDGRHARRGHAAADRGGVDLERGGCGGDRVRRGRRNDTHRRFGAGQRDFDRQQIGQALAVGEHGRDTVVDAEEISEQRRVEDGDHASKNTVSRSPCRRISQR